MGAITPFIEADAREIREAARAIINGEYISPHLVQFVAKWRWIIEAVLLYLNAENGSLNIPISGDLFETPVRTIQVVKIVQAEYRDKIRREMKRK